MDRPWGKWMVLAMQPGYKVKKLTVNPGCSLSKQYHSHRDEYWVILTGRGDLYLNHENLGKRLISNLCLKRGDHLHIPKQVIHKVTNTGDEPLIIIETQVGEITEEGDIVRLD